MLATLSPLPSLANSSMFGRSGACDSGSTSALAAIRPPVREPAPSGAMAMSRYWIASAAPTWSAGAAGSGSNGAGAMKATVAHSRESVAAPRHQRRESTSSPRSTIRSMSRQALAAAAEAGASGGAGRATAPPAFRHSARMSSKALPPVKEVDPARLLRNGCHCHG